MVVRWGPKAYKLLNGVFCVYKPSGVPCFKVIDTIQRNLAKDLNALPCYQQERITEDKETKTLVLNTPEPSGLSLQNHRLVLGERYEPSDFVVKYVSNMCKHSSGVLVMSVGTRHNYMEKIAAAKYLRVYHVQGTFGVATSNYSPKGKVLQRTTYHHITKLKLDKVCAASQASHQKHMFEYAGVNPESQKAYELASVGIVRPQSKDTPPIVYGIKCIDFNLPDFTLEIHSINEKSEFLRALIHDIGLKLKSTAVCSSVRRIRHGYFTLDHSLLRANWHLDQILANMKTCKELTKPKILISDRNVKPLQDTKLLAVGESKFLTGDKDKLVAKGDEINSDSDSELLAGNDNNLVAKGDEMNSDIDTELLAGNDNKLVAKADEISFPGNDAKSISADSVKLQTDYVGELISDSELSSIDELINESELINDGELSNDSKFSYEGNMSNNGELMKESESVKEDELITEGESINDDGLVDIVKMSNNGELMNNSELMNASESINEGEFIDDCESINKGELRNASDYSNKDEMSNNSELMKDSESVKGGELIVEWDQLMMVNRFTREN